MGYHEATVKPPKMAPSAPASLPLIISLPWFSSRRSTRKGSRLTMFSRVYAAASCTTPRFWAMGLALPLKCCVIAASISASSIPSSSTSAPT